MSSTKVAGTPSRVGFPWLELGIILLLLLAVLTIIISPSSGSSSSPPAATYSTTATANATFILPADKVQSDLSDLQPNSNIVVILVSGDHKANKYNATLLDVDGVGNEPLPLPYPKKNAATVRISLSRSAYDIADFANQLTGVSTIFLLPSTPPNSNPSPTPSAPPYSTTATANAIFILPAAKIQSDLSGLQPNSNILIVLVSNDHKAANNYDAILLDVEGTGNDLLPTPYQKINAATVRISLSRSAYDIGDFASQLTDASAIFLLPSTPSTGTVTPILQERSFVLPAAKILSNLSTVHPKDSVTVILVENQQLHFYYNAMVNQVLGVNGATISPPYENEKVALVGITLAQQTTNDEIKAFISQLSDISGIYLVRTP
jgi:hypothetical protein